MTTTPHGRAATARRRIDAAQARFARWSRWPHAIGLEPAALDPLADAIEAADDALWAIECPGHAGSAAEKGLKVALADLWRVEDGLTRAIAAYARAADDPTIRRRAGLPGPKVSKGTAVPLHAVLISATPRPHGRVELAIECPMLGRARGLYVQVRRRAGAWGRYAPVGITFQPTFLDQNAHEGGEAAAYKVVAFHEGVRGPLSDRVVVPIPRQNPPTKACTRRR